ncbi:MAG: copper homeostasis protein CutC [Bacteroidetes bacterium]|nr:copper homeostasis protein CutC [Bacteroidota bacterium]
MKKDVKIEVCVDSVESAMIAQQAGAHRIELCNNLIEGGTTPSAASIEIARKHLKIGLNVIIRPRGGDFLYSALELEIIKKDIQIAKSLGTEGVVFGMLTPEGKINEEICKSLIEIARPMSVTFHRAFDLCVDPFEGMETLINLGVDRILTSGQKNKAEDGLTLLTELVETANNRIIIMPGSGINEQNFSKIMNQCKAREYHVSCRTEIESKMLFRREDVKMGSFPNYNEYAYKQNDLQKLKSIIHVINH